MSRPALEIRCVRTRRLCLRTATPALRRTGRMNLSRSTGRHLERPCTDSLCTSVGTVKLTGRLQQPEARQGRLCTVCRAHTLAGRSGEWRPAFCHSCRKSQPHPRSHTNHGCRYRSPPGTMRTWRGRLQRQWPRVRAILRSCLRRSPSSLPDPGSGRCSPPFVSVSQAGRAPR